MRKRITKRSVDALEPATSPEGRRRDAFVWDSDLAGFGCKVTVRGRKLYVLQYRTKSQTWKQAPKRITLGTHGELTPEQARRRAAELMRDIRSGKDPTPLRQAAAEPTVADLAQRFLQEYLPSKKKPPRASTIAYYEIIFRVHIVPRLGTMAVSEVSTEDVERLHRALKNRPYIANRTLSVVRHAFDQAERWGWRGQNSNPAKHIDRYPEARRGERKAVMLSSTQMRDLLSAIAEDEALNANPVACAAVRTAFWTGWRIGEVLSLQWRNVDLDTGTAKLVRTKTADEEYRQLPAEAVDVLREVPTVASCPYVFPGQDLRGHLTTVRKPWKRIRKRAGLDDLDGLGPLRIHDLRHNVISWDVSRGVPLEIAGRNVGHRSRRSTEVYAHFAPDALKQAADARARAMREAMEGEEEKSAPA